MSKKIANALATRNVAYSTNEHSVERSFTLNGIPISLSRTTYVQHDLILPQPTGVRFNAVRRRWYHLLLQIFGRGRKLGQEQLDRVAALSTTQRDAAVTFFARPGRASLIAQLTQAGSQVRWDDDHVIVDVPNTAFPDDGLAQITLLLDTVLPAATAPKSAGS